MSDSDKDTSAAIDKVVGAFRAQREQGKADATEAPADTAAESATEPTPVKKLEEAPEPQGGGNSETPTKAFKIPAQVSAAAAAESDSGTDDLVEENVVGDPLTGEAAEIDSAIDADAVEKASLVEHSIELPADEATADETPDDEAAVGDATPTEQIPAPEVAASEAPTTEMKVPAAAAAAAGVAAGGAAAASAGAGKSAPQVVAPAQASDEKRSRGKMVGILIAVVIVIAAIAIGLWYALVGSSPEHKVAEAAKDYQNAMTSGDLDKLREVTCGEEYAYYSKIPDAAFQKAYEAQKNRNELMTFDDVKAVEINGDTARVGVDMYPSNDPSKTAPAQITLQNVDGTWKVCKQP
ncbi:DUF4878 domain-containing protein [Gordonia neofelifaecis]|uniref:Uncharacterized protein n=1 Tax=Gordonia neofelifaecis NRRL B-59395 TaxID=644548 RepID=F1YLS2_9ACTN|nr:DUF4878 domain-containing protein [Gordonia neofelifaecis]EGD54466.1 hypothetical protein SCNU_14329 [Gordonia neofelifaecis NRRL B-59395]